MLIGSLLVAGCGGGGSDHDIVDGPPRLDEPGSDATAADYITTEFAAQRGLALIHAAEGYALLAGAGAAAGGEGVTIGIADSGVDPDHPEFDGRLMTATVPVTLIAEDLGTGDDDGHGTLMASVAAGRRDGTGIHGVAYNASLTSIKVFSDVIAGANATFHSDAAAAIRSRHRLTFS